MRNIDLSRFKCYECGSGEYKIVKHKKNVGVYCGSCGAYCKFLNKRELREMGLVRDYGENGGVELKAINRDCDAVPKGVVNIFRGFHMHHRAKNKTK